MESLENKEWTNDFCPEEKSWIDDVAELQIGKYVKFPIDRWVEVKFLQEIPDIRPIMYYGKATKEFTWTVELNGEKKLLSRSAVSLLSRLAEIAKKEGGLLNRKVRIRLVIEGSKQKYEVADFGLQ